MVEKEQAKETIEKLVQDYIAQAGSVKSHGYKEEWAKENFIGPLFRALGWDLHNRAGSMVRPTIADFQSAQSVSSRSCATRFRPGVGDMAAEAVAGNLNLSPLGLTD